MRLTRGWCLSAKSPTPALTYRSLPRSRKKVSVRTVASAARNPAAPTAICPVDEKRPLSNPPSCFLSSSIWSANLCTRPPSPLSLASPLRYSVGPSGALAAVVTNLMKPFIWSTSSGTKIPTTKSSATNTPQVGEPYGEGALHQPVSALEPVYGRVEHRRQKEGDHEPTYEGPDLPEQEDRYENHHRGEQGDGDGANHLRSGGACPSRTLVGHGSIRCRRCRFGSRLGFC